LWQPGAAAASLDAAWACRRDKRRGIGRHAEETIASAAIRGGSLPPDIFRESFVRHDVSTMTGAAKK
jgi:hypothetical protein